MDLSQSFLDTTFGEDNVTAVEQFDVLYHGWECDPYGYLVTLQDNSKHLVLTNHGMPVLADKSSLEDLINSYQRVLEDTQAIYDQL